MTGARKADVFNLSVEGEPEYFANGVLVHNCDVLSYGVLSAPWTTMRETPTFGSSSRRVAPSFGAARPTGW